jgi:hypothetical protein
MVNFFQILKRQKLSKLGERIVRLPSVNTDAFKRFIARFKNRRV